MKIDFKEKKISGKTASGEIRNAKIQSMDRIDGKLILQGTQNAMAWSMVITEATQKMTLTASGDEAGFGGSEGTYFGYTGITWRFLKNWSASLYGQYTVIEYENGSKGDPDWYLYDVDEFGLGIGVLFHW